MPTDPSAGPSSPSPAELETALNALDSACSCGKYEQAFASDCDICTLTALRALVRSVEERTLREAAKVAENPYSDEVEAFGGDEPFAVGGKIARALLARIELRSRLASLEETRER